VERLVSVPFELPPEPDRDLGISLVLMMAQPSQWVRRRVEQVSFLDVSTIRRTVSVDFAISERVPVHDGVKVVPLARLKKQPLRAFDLRDESGSPVPILGTEANGFAAWSLLAVAAEAVTQERPPPLVLRDLALLAYAPAYCADIAASWLLSGLSEARYRGKLAQDDWFRPLAQELSSGFLMLGVLGVPGEEGENRPRRILKYSYNEPVVVEARSPAERLGWEPYSVRFEVPLVDLTESYHFEFTSPDGIRSPCATLRSWIEEPTGRSEIELSDPYGRSPVHLHLGAAPRYAGAEVDVDLAPATSGLIRWGTWITAGIVSVIIVTMLLSTRLGGSQSDAAVALIIAGPGVVATLIVKPDEHALASALLRWIRAVVMVGAVAAYLAAGVVVAGPKSESHLRWMLAMPLVMALAALAILGKAALASRNHDRASGVVT
jgi:hypothetical protein